MKTLYAPRKFYSRLTVPLGAMLLLMAALVSGARAQSTTIEFPTPVRGGEIGGTIAPRDLGDPRLTRYFYAFNGTPGDLIVTAESVNLEGDVDVFTAGVLRPLAKISLYAGVSKSGGSKTIYLRSRESLILRVEARTPNDSEGSFRVRFTGSFEPLGSDVPDPEPVIPTVSSESKTGRRVTATGARIEEPVPTATTTTEPTTTETTKPATEPSAVTETPATETAEAAKPDAVRPRTPRTRRNTRTPSRNTRTRPSSTARRTPAPPETTATTAPAVEPASGPRLIIETKDGMKVERYMTTVRRVTVDRGQIVVVTTDGKIDRQPMSNVLRMAIEP